MTDFSLGCIHHVVVIWSRYCDTLVVWRGLRELFTRIFLNYWVLGILPFLNEKLLLKVINKQW